MLLETMKLIEDARRVADLIAEFVEGSDLTAYSDTP